MLLPVLRLVFEFVHRPLQLHRRLVAFAVEVVNLTEPPAVGFVGLKLADTVGAGIGAVTVKLTLAVVVPAGFVAFTVQLVTPSVVTVVAPKLRSWPA